MAYQDDETSKHDGRPIELYEFIGNQTTHRLTSHGEDVTFGGDVYSSVALRRNEIHASQIGDRSLEIEIPRVLQIVTDYAFGVPDFDLTLTLHRTHDLSSSVVYWKGKVTGIRVEADRATIVIAPLAADALETPVPRVRVQQICNHRLYDSRCTVDENNFVESTSIASIASDTEFDVSSMGSQPNQWAKGGTVERTSTGEKRLIIDQTGTTIRIMYPFHELGVSDLVKVFAGCDRSLSDCANKFSNQDNFGGHPYVPKTNPFRSVFGISK